MNCDSLTGLGNLESIESCFQEYTRDRSSLTIISIDIDGFIYFNERYGHAEGDEQLKRIADLIRHNTPHNLDIFRTGGDEFAILLKNSTMAKTFCLATDICKAVNKSLSHLPMLRRIVVFDDRSSLELDRLLTISCGIACYPEHGFDFATLYLHAREATGRGGKSTHGGIVGIRSFLQ